MGASIVVSEAGCPWPAIPSRSYAVAVASKYRKPVGCQCYNGVREMNDKPDKTTVVVKPTSYQPSTAELKADVALSGVNTSGGLRPMMGTNLSPRSRSAVAVLSRPLREGVDRNYNGGSVAIATLLGPNGPNVHI